MVEIIYKMMEDLKSAMNESAATSLVHTVGQRVFLHNFDTKGKSLILTSHVVQQLLESVPGLVSASQACQAV